jgi:hypothetical protein
MLTLQVTRADLNALNDILIEAEEDTQTFLRETQEEDEVRRLRRLARQIARWLKIVGEIE